MTSMSPARAKDWLTEAQSDAQFAKHGLGGGFYAQTCFVAQQVAEKALKALLYHRNASLIFTHSLKQMLGALKLNGELQHAASVLDLYYVTARYPDMLAAGSPSGSFSQRQAEEAIAFAQLFLDAAQAEVAP